MTASEHQSVLLNEVVHYLDPKPGEFMIDGTVDGGGHAGAITEKIMPGGKGVFLGVDWDKAMIAKRAAERRFGGREHYAHGNYADLPEILVREKLGKADGLLLDLGFSSEQLSRAGRGFSFGEEAADEPLLMTYDDEQRPVAELLRGIREDALADIIFQYGGERMSRRIAKAIVEQERRRAILTSGELAATVRSALPGQYERGRIDPATRTFQALRIYANDELGNLGRLLERVSDVVRPGGRVAIITFHSLEDRIVKQSFQTSAKEERIKILTKKPIEASREEARENPRSRSAKLRAAILL